MERYILIIHHGDLNTEVEHSLKSALQSKIPRPTFLSVLNVNLTDENSEIPFHENEWPSWKECQELGNELNSFEIESWTVLAAAINFLADRLPEIGQYFLDVFCYGKVFSDETPEQNIEISIFLERLCRWHNAHLVFHCPKDVSTGQQAVLDKWVDWLCGSLCRDTWPFPDLKLWHGSVTLSTNVVLDGFELVFLEDSERLLNEANDHGYLRKMLPRREISRMSTSLEFLLDCSQMSIPSYLYSPIKFLLQIPEGKQTSDACHNFVEFFETKPTYCMIFSLAFTCLGLKRDSQKYDFKAWVEVFEKGKVVEVRPQTSLPDDCPHLTLVLYYDANVCQSGNSLVAHLLIDPCDLNLPRILPCVLAPSLPVASEDAVAELKELIPMLDKDWTLDHSPPTSCEPARQMVDPADWPERRYLLQKELKTQRHSSSLDGLSPPPSNRRVIEIKLGDFSKYFDSSGVPKRKRSSPSKKENVPCVISGGQGKYPLSSDQTFEEVRNSSWPDLLRCRYHDIYLNHSSWKEEQETACNRLKEQFVLEETASSNPSSQKPWVLCALTQRKPRQTFKNPTDLHSKLRKCKSASSFESTRKARRSSPRKSKESVLKVSGQVRPQRQAPGRADSSERQPPVLKAMCPVSRPAVSRTHSLPKLQDAETDVTQPDDVRRSPRFKQKQGLRSSANACQKNSDDLSELHKKKLREAVALALESEGITLNSPSFKACGRRLFNVCKAFVKDILGKGSTSALMRKIASAHVKQVIDFEKIKS